MKKRFGFTLAEVLITLGIIGVVAAMTIPSLIQNTASVRNSSQFRKSLATLTNALEMAQAHNGIGNVTELADVCTANPANDTLDTDPVGEAAHANSICGLINTTLNGARYVGVDADAYNGGTTPIPAQTGTAAGALVFQLADGSWLGVDQAAKDTCRTNPGEDPAGAAALAVNGACRGYIDVNGRAGTSLGPTCNNGNDAPLLNNTSAEAQANCVVRPGDVHDVFPIIFHDGTVSAGSNAAAVVLTRAR